MIIDIGGTKTTAVVFNDQGEPITDFIVKSSRTYEGEDAVFQNTVELAYEVLEAAGMKKEDIAGVGVAAPGPLDYRTGLILDVGMEEFPARGSSEGGIRRSCLCGKRWKSGGPC